MKGIKKTNKPIITEYYELHRGFMDKGQFRHLYREVEPHLQARSSRRSCVETSLDDIYYRDLPHITWTPLVTEIRDQLIDAFNAPISLVLVHYYHDHQATINWHSDREATNSDIFSVSVGGTRRFCLRSKTTDTIHTFDLHDGDLFIMKTGCQDRYEHCIKSIKAYNDPRINLTFRSQ